MPPRNAPKERAWGTRYDSLGSWSQSSPPASDTSALSSSSPSHNRATSVAHSPTLLQHSPETQIHANINPNVSEKMPHDASIFVGSLPSHIDHNELTRLLSEHLAGFTEVKSVKVVRDNKGGVCAFVQCQDAQSAARLIETLQSQPPRPFIGRYLRYEPARAFRTLLVSYRAPTQFVRAKAVLQDNPASGAGAGENQIVALEPATAMRIFRPHQSKYLAITYNDESQPSQGPSATTACTTQPTHDPFSGEGFYLTSLKYDVETMRSLAAAFGPIEHFGEFFITGEDFVHEDGMSEQDRIHPHDAPRSANMATEIWEVKWKHREDCVTALMTLRRIPHITVTWAHQQLNLLNGSNSESRLSSPNVTPVPRFGSCSSPGRARTHIQTYSSSPTSSDYQRVNTIRASFSQDCAVEIPSVQFKVASSTSQGNIVSDGGVFPQHTPLSVVSHHSLSTHRHDASVENFATQPELVATKWSDTDFPPLHNPRHTSEFEVEQDHTDGDSRSDGACEPLASPSPSPSSSLAVQPATPHPTDEIEAVADKRSTDVEEPSPPGSGLSVLLQYETEAGQDVTVPPTPEHTLSDLTPVTPSSMQSYPLTPQSAIHAADSVEVADGFPSTPYNSTPRKPNMQDDTRQNHQPDTPKHFDPFTIFVGGLDMYGTSSWDEIKLRSIFGKYGEIEDVQIVRPLVKRSAFAFIRYRAPDAGARAVAGEHNRPHDGHQIRVLLRENNHARSPWKIARNRGRTPFDVSYEHGEHDISTTTSQSPVRSTDVGTYTQNRPSSQGPVPGPHFSGTSEATNGQGTFNPYGFSGTAHSLPSPETPSVSRERSSQYPTRADSTSTTATSASPSPSTLGHSQAHIPGTVPHYSFPMNMGYYPNQWMQAYPPYPYAFPFMPHGYLPGPQTSYMTTADGSGYSSASHPGHWVAVSDPHKSQSSSTTREQSPLHVHPPHTTQPPLRPTGFMQGEQGTLIPVYQPDALNRYMTNGNGRTDTPPAAPTQHQQSSAVWPQYPQMPMYPYVYHHPPTILPPPPHQLPMSTTAVGQSAPWNPNAAATPPYGAVQAPGQYPSAPQSFMSSSASTVSTGTSHMTGNFRHSIAGPGQVSSHQYAGLRHNGGRRYQRREVQWK